MNNENADTNDSYEGPYSSEWWVDDLTDEERRLYPEKFWDRLPGASLPASVVEETDVPVEMSDGLKLAANVFRPDRAGSFPVIVAFTPFSKDYYGQHAALGVSERTAFEAPDPGFWVPHGYVVVLFDQRGTGRSPSGGTGGPYDYHDGIEWAGTRPWSNGNVGMFGHSGLAAVQWDVASLEEPPSHLEAIVPWGGFSDLMRDSACPGGIPNTEMGVSRGENIPLWQRDFVPEDRPPLPSVLGEGPAPPLENITVPVLIGAAWADREHHLRGNLRAWRRVSTPLEHKWLYTYHERKWNGLYTPPENREMQLRFLDHFLAGEETGITETPRVRLAVSDTLFDYEVRYEHDWPIDRTEYTKLYLDARDGSLRRTEPADGATATYDSTLEDGRATFDITFDQRTELSGHTMLEVWVSPEDAEDMDLFVTLRKFDSAGHEVRFPTEFAPGRNPVDLGWLRLSKRALDEERSEAWLPVQRSVEPGPPEQRVAPGEVVPAHVQLVGSSTLFHADETLRLEIAGHHGVEDDLVFGYEDLVNEGTHAIHTGGERASYLQVPVVPEADHYETFSLRPRRVPGGEGGPTPDGR